jgi:hypothetical protein
MTLIGYNRTNQITEINELESKVSKEKSEAWTSERFKYEFFLCLTKVFDTNRSNSITADERGFLTDRKYYAEAKKIMYWIPISKPSELVPPFVINLSDLTPRLKAEFQDFCKLNERQEIGMFLKEIAARFFEGIDYAYTHDSVLSHLKVVLRK